MVTLDTNVLLRAVVDDPQAPEQTMASRALLRQAWLGGDQIYVPDVVVVEVVWVLRKVLKTSKEEIVALLRGLLENALFVFDDASSLHRAVQTWERDRGDLADFIIGERAVSRSALPVYTFDAALHHDSRYRAPGLSGAPRAR